MVGVGPSSPQPPSLFCYGYETNLNIFWKYLIHTFKYGGSAANTKNIDAKISINNYIEWLKYEQNYARIQGNS